MLNNEIARMIEEGTMTDDVLLSEFGKRLNEVLTGQRAVVVNTGGDCMALDILPVTASGEVDTTPRNRGGDYLSVVVSPDGWDLLCFRITTDADPTELSSDADIASAFLSVLNLAQHGGNEVTRCPGCDQTLTMGEHGSSCGDPDHGCCMESAYAFDVERNGAERAEWDEVLAKSGPPTATQQATIIAAHEAFANAYQALHGND